eukprot:Gb_04436 [translate_table: standard]
MWKRAMNIASRLATGLASSEKRRSFIRSAIDFSSISQSENKCNLGGQMHGLWRQVLIPDRWGGVIGRGVSVETASASAQPLHIGMKRLTGSDSGIVEVILDRPGAMNAIGSEALKCLQRILETVKGDSSVRVVMLRSGVHGVFCAGADLKERRRMSNCEVKRFVSSLRSTFWSLERLCVPTISVIEGAALGGGLELALSCDLRICGDEATFGLPETGLAVIPGAGGTQRLPRLIGSSRAKELIFTGRKVDGKEAVAIGLVNHCVEAGGAYSKALQIARHINQKGPLAIKMAKRSVDRGSEVDACSGMFIEESCYAQLLNTKDRLEGLAAFAEKRKPHYSGN